MSIDRKKYMSIEEVRWLRKVAAAESITDLAAGHIRGVMAWMLVDIALDTGLRVSELAALRVGDFDRNRKSLSVQRLKRRKPLRETLALSPELSRHLAAFIRWKAVVDQPVGDGDALFVGKRGPITMQGLQYVWRVAIKSAGLPRELTIKSARHTLAVHLLHKTGNLRQVQKQLGHASPIITANLYADISFSEMAEGVTGLYDKPPKEAKPRRKKATSIDDFLSSKDWPPDPA